MFRVSLSLRIDEPKLPDPELETTPWLELRGVMNALADWLRRDHQ